MAATEANLSRVGDDWGGGGVGKPGDARMTVEDRTTERGPQALMRRLDNTDQYFYLGT